jgi:hypothetical protein
VQYLAQPFPSEGDGPVGVVGQVVGEFVDVRVNGRPSFTGRVRAVATMNVSSSGLIRRGRPPAQRGSNASSPISLNRWITWRTVSSSAATSRAIAATVVPEADAMMIVARRTRIEPCLPRRTIACNRWPSSSVSRRARTGSAIPPTSRDRGLSIPTVAVKPSDQSQASRRVVTTRERMWSSH